MSFQELGQGSRLCGMMEETFLKIQSSGCKYYLMIKCPSDADVVLGVTLVNGAEVWCGDGKNSNLNLQKLLPSCSNISLVSSSM